MAAPSAGASSTSAGQAATPSSDTTQATAPRGVMLPDPRLTPGATDPRVTQANIAQTICVSGYTATVRPPESVTAAIKANAMIAYGIRDMPGNYELDHLVALELGGAPADTRNLWPEPWENRGARRAARGGGAETKDRVENAAHLAVCSGRLPLAVAQQGMEANWYALGRTLGVF
ncbi:MAG TPA: hypothetical protein VKQ71_06765 [Acidimicrobiales bacterium]|nr:hypothetical protein [Acidimicrobiales bacterium]